MQVGCYQCDAGDNGNKTKGKGKGPCTAFGPAPLILGLVLFVDLGLAEELG